MPIGSKVELGLLRDGKPVTVTVELQQSNQTQVDSSTIFDGIEGAEISNKGQDKGVVVNNVKAGTPASADSPQERRRHRRGESAAGEKHRRSAENLRRQTVRTGAEHSARRRLYLSAVAVTASAPQPLPSPRAGAFFVL